MRAIYTQFSGLAGLLAFLNQLWSYAPLDRTILVGFATGLGLYFLLMLGDVSIHRILAHTPPALAEEGAGAGASAVAASGDAKAESADKAPKAAKAA